MRLCSAEKQSIIPNLIVLSGFRWNKANTVLHTSSYCVVILSLHDLENNCCKNTSDQNEHRCKKMILFSMHGCIIGTNGHVHILFAGPPFGT